MYNKKKSTQITPRSFKGRPGSAIIDIGQPIVEEEAINVTTLEENASTPQQVNLHLKELFTITTTKNLI